MTSSNASVPHKRPDWDEYFIEMAKVVSLRATCDRGRTGCVIVQGKHPVVVGYVGSPPGMPHCDEVGHQLKKVTHEDGSESMHCMRTIHGEQNAIAQAAKLGVSLDGATLYCKLAPCRTCAMLVVAVGIKKVVAEKKYQLATETEDFFRRGGVELVYLTDEVQQYPSSK